MESRQGNMLQSLRAVEDFLATNAATLGEIVNTGTRKQLATLIDALNATVAEQAGSSVIAQGSTRRYWALRQALERDHMAPIARMARTEMPLAPEVEALRMPRSNWAAERLAAAAHGMAKATEPFRAGFVEAGLPDDFVERLTAAADAMVHALSDRAQDRGRLRGATKGLQRTLASGRRVVQVIDALVASKLSDDPALVANWKQVKRVRHVPVRAQAEPAPTPVVLPIDAKLAAAMVEPTQTGTVANG
jgi:hypothetical protein